MPRPAFDFRGRPFDPFDHHEYGLIRINEHQYVKCTNDCCKPRWLVVEPEGEYR